MGGPYEMGGDGDDDSAPAAYKRGLFAGRAEAEARIKTLEALVQKCKNYDARLCRGPCQGCSEFEKRGRS